MHSRLPEELRLRLGVVMGSILPHIREISLLRFRGRELSEPRPRSRYLATVNHPDHSRLSRS